MDCPNSTIYDIIHLSRPFAYFSFLQEKYIKFSCWHLLIVTAILIRLLVVFLSAFYGCFFYLCFILFVSMFTYLFDCAGSY